MHPASRWIALGLGFLAACAPVRVVTTPVPVPTPGTPIRYALRSEPSRFATGRMISLDRDTLIFERLVSDTRAFGRFARVERTPWVTDRIPTDSIAELQARVGRRSNAGRGVLIGGASGPHSARCVRSPPTRTRGSRGRIPGSASSPVS